MVLRIVGKPPWQPRPLIRALEGIGRNKENSLSTNSGGSNCPMDSNGIRMHEAIWERNRDLNKQPPCKTMAWYNGKPNSRPQVWTICVEREHLGGAYSGRHWVTSD